jgi:alpha-N-arabinofuranosidase
MVNVIAPIFTEKGGAAIRQTTFYPFALAAQHCTGVALRVLGKTPQIESAAYGPVSGLPLAATYNAERGELAVICCNISAADITLELDLRSFGTLRLLSHQVMSGDLAATNTLSHPESVKPASLACPLEPTAAPEIRLPPESFNMLLFSTAV